jgi:hypothetical protein
MIIARLYPEAKRANSTAEVPEQGSGLHVVNASVCRLKCLFWQISMEISF